MVTNLATLNPRDKLHFVRIKMSLMLSDSRDSAIIADVEPVIKDSIVTILGAKEFAQIASNESRERIRIECREKMISLLNEKFGKPIIMDVLFKLRLSVNQFIQQGLTKGNLVSPFSFKD